MGALDVRPQTNGLQGRVCPCALTVRDRARRRPRPTPVTPLYSMISARRLLATILPRQWPVCAKGRTHRKGKEIFMRVVSLALLVTIAAAAPVAAQNTSDPSPQSTGQLSGATGDDNSMSTQ